jgi:glycosyltransferase involved in cell wall biosynthesis
MSSGVCPVVTDVGGNRAVLGPDLAHRLLPPSAPEQLAESWRDALRDAPRRISDGAKARARVVERHGVASMVAAYERLYEEVLSSQFSGA